MRRESMGSSEGAVFSYEDEGVGGALMYWGYKFRFGLFEEGDAEVALGKILSVLPLATRAAAQGMAIHAPPMGLEPAVRATLQILREAEQERRKIQIQYRDAARAPTERTLRPLGCFYWGKVWTLAAWCENRADFRSFRLDRMEQVQTVEGKSGKYCEEPGKTLADYLRTMVPPDARAQLAADV